jgi:hypothetical protein
MEKIIKRELIIYSAILVVLIVLMHPDMLSDPAARLGLMQQHQNYIHPLLYTLFFYLILVVVRAAFNWITRLLTRDRSDGEA